MYARPVNEGENLANSTDTNGGPSTNPALSHYANASHLTMPGFTGSSATSFPLAFTKYNLSILASPKVQSGAQLRPKPIASSAPSSPASNKTVVSADEASPQNKKKRKVHGESDSKAVFVSSPPKKPRQNSVLDLAKKIDMLIGVINEVKYMVGELKSEIEVVKQQQKAITELPSATHNLATKILSLERDIDTQNSRIQYLQNAFLPDVYPDIANDAATTAPVVTASSSSYEYLNDILRATDSDSRGLDDFLTTGCDVSALFQSSSSSVTHGLNFFNRSDQSPEVLNGVVRATTMQSPLPISHGSSLRPTSS